MPQPAPEFLSGRPPKQTVTEQSRPPPKPLHDHHHAQIHYPFWFGGSAAAMGAVLTHPLDLVKVRLQTRAPDAPKNMIGTFGHILKIEGPLGLYSGLSAALLRQLTYSTARFGVYEDLKQRFAPEQTRENPTGKMSTLGLIACSSLAGFVGGVVGNPGDVLNVRMQSDFAKPPAERRNYKHAIDGLIRMVREEKVSALFRGVGANSARALLMTASQLASYDWFKNTYHTFFGLHEGVPLHFASSLSAGLVATTICSPVDVVKTRIMSAGAKARFMDIVKEATAKEGYLWMFRGWVPSFIRLGPHTIFTMIFFEQHKKIYRQMKGLPEPE